MAYVCNYSRPGPLSQKDKGIVTVGKRRGKIVCLFVVCLFFIYIYIFSCLILIGCYINDAWGTETYPTTCGLVRK